ncbi:sigma factor-like helix-turn-helix DNA-binding protein [Sphingobium sp.]|uniref:sigma factor-like helix-turn-helix DNA-binding protein n=1 Tax=Sphingobium sp. TaxID=1912891 RepID=UPI0028BE8297|nr:sigma factor-like helix-turn-helix DNA-binding protein [Sphingobium sp.]
MRRENLIRCLRAFAFLGRSHHASRPERTNGEEISERAGPPAISFARIRFADRADVAIDPLETKFRVSPSGVAVRAWLILDSTELPTALFGSIVSADQKLADLPPQARRVFFLAAAYGLSITDIARRLGLSRRRTRRWLLLAIASLGDRSL